MVTTSCTDMCCAERAEWSDRIAFKTDVKLNVLGTISSQDPTDIDRVFETQECIVRIRDGLQTHTTRT